MRRLVSEIGDRFGDHASYLLASVSALFPCVRGEMGGHPAHCVLGCRRHDHDECVSICLDDGFPPLAEARVAHPSKAEKEEFMKKLYITKNEESYDVVQSENIQLLLEENEGVYPINGMDYVNFKGLEREGRERCHLLRSFYERGREKYQHISTYDKHQAKRKEALMEVLTYPSTFTFLKNRQKQRFTILQKGRIHHFYIWHETEEKPICELIESVDDFFVGATERTKRNLMRILVN
jgi:hypothetical protein